MHTDYIKYLQSLNNANSSNDNAIAESQFTNPFYEKIRVESNIGRNIVERIQNKPSLIILTGHAGDGKTSLLHQILRQLEAIQPGQNLAEQDLVSINWNKEKIYYVKDMSELVSEKQVESIQKAFKNKNNGGSSIIVSNTGTLIDVFKNYYKDKFSDNEIEMDILKLMDGGSLEEGFVGDESILLINLALIDNTEIVAQLIDKLLQEELWGENDGCKLGEECPIYNNYKILKRHQEKFKKLVITYYKWLAENNKRLTIRQILSHLTFAITGNAPCDKVTAASKKSFLQNYHISNLFFGYVGTKKDKNAQKIKSIVEIQHLNLDEKKLLFDQDLFVKEDFSVLVPEVRELAEQHWKDHMRRFLSDEKSSLYSNEAIEVRKSMRRMQILFSNTDEEQTELLLSNMYSPIFVKYLKYISEGIRSRPRKHLKEMIFNALKIIISGDMDKSLNSNILYLPLRRSGLNNQNVYLLVGKVDEDDFEVEVLPAENIVSCTSSYKMYLKFNKLDEKQELSLPLLEYFYHISAGSLSTKLNPMLSHGINKLKSQLYTKYKYNDSEEVIKVLVKTLNGAKIIDIEYDADTKKLYFE